MIYNAMFSLNLRDIKISYTKLIVLSNPFLSLLIGCLSLCAGHSQPFKADLKLNVMFGII